MQKPRKYLLIPAVFFCAVSVSAASHFKDRYIEQYDSDGDGAVSAKEFERARRDKFDFTDTNKDGVVSDEEYVYEYEDRLDGRITKEREGHVKQTGIRFASLDKDKDALIKQSEFIKTGNWAFTHYDNNKDGTINSVDADIERQEKAEKEAKDKEQGKAPAEQSRRTRSVIRMPSTHSRRGLFEIYDADGDEEVSRREFDAERQAAFRFMDFDRSGGVTEEEYLNEYENRLDAGIERSRRAQIRQTYVRYGVLDNDGDGKMTFAEYQKSGNRSFKRWDTNKDGSVSADDPVPLPRKRYAKSDKKS